MKGRYWIFDVASDERGEKIYIWGFDPSGEANLFLDSSFKDFFYVIDVDLERLRAKLAESLGSRFSSISIGLTKKVINGVEKDVYIISGPEDPVKIAARSVGESFGFDKIFEDDVRYTQKYILYRGLKVCSWYNLSIAEEVNVKTYKGYGISSFTQGDEDAPPKLKVVSLDFIVTSESGSPDPDKDPVNAVALFDGVATKWFVSEDGNDVRMLREFIDYFTRLDPDIVVSFQGNRVYYPYIVNRLKKSGLNLELGRFPLEVHQSILGHFSIGGRINIDLYEYVDDIPFFQRKTLEELAQYLRIEGPKLSIDPLLYNRFWNNRRGELMDYVSWRVEALYNSFKRLEDDIFALSNVTGIPPDYVLTSSSGRQIEFYIMSEAVKKGLIIPRSVERFTRSYPGGLVIKPIVGLHSSVCVIDFKSMYPSLMIKYNISPETIVSTPVDEGVFFNDIGLGVRFDIEGLFPEILRSLLRLRDEARSRLKELDRSNPEYRILDARQRIYKILANTVYGYMGWANARWYSYEGASLVTYLGRKTISEAIEFASKLGLKVIYGDTDSLFVKYDEDKVDKLLRLISDRMGLEAKVDKIYKAILFTEAKKRYAGLTLDGLIDVVGLEYTRRDWCDYARELQYKVLDVVLRYGDKRQALDIFREYVSKIRKGEVQIEKLVIWEQITRNLRDYKANAPHIEVAKELERRGWRIRRGMFIGYVVLKGSGPIYRRSKYYVEADISQIDVNYYIYHQLLPVVYRVLAPLGVTKSSLEAIAAGTGRGLDMFMG